MQDYGIFLGSPGDPDIINSNGRLMGMEDVLCCLLTEDEAALRFIRKRALMKLKVMERILDRCRGMIDFMWLGEDLGTQRGPMISLELFRKQIRPIHQMYVDLADAYGIPVLIHTCGSSSWAYEDFIEMGVRGVDTLQPEAWHMEPEYLKKQFGGRLCFRGCISTAGPLAWGTPAQVEETCRRTLEIMMDGYGYHFAPPMRSRITHRWKMSSPCTGRRTEKESISEQPGDLIPVNRRKYTVMEGRTHPRLPFFGAIRPASDRHACNLPEGMLS